MRVVHVCQKNLLFQEFCSLSVTAPTHAFKLSSWISRCKFKKNHHPTHRMFWKAEWEQAWLRQRGLGKHRLVVEPVPRRCRCGAVRPDSLVVPNFPLLFSSSLPLIPGLASAQGKPVAACHLMEALWARVPLFLGSGVSVGACLSPLTSLRTSGLLNRIDARCLK